VADRDARRVLGAPHHGRGVLEPIVHEVKVQRSDLLCDLRRATKREGYLQLGGECWYVDQGGHRRARRDSARMRRARRRRRRPDRARARRRGVRRGWAFALWMALARATPVEGWRLEDAQAALGGDRAGRRRRRRAAGDAAAA
jgi:hypothetical protein